MSKREDARRLASKEQGELIKRAIAAAAAVLEPEGIVAVSLVVGRYDAEGAGWRFRGVNTEAVPLSEIFGALANYRAALLVALRKKEAVRN